MRLRLVQPALMALGDRDDVHIRLIAKVEHVPLADQAIADEADADFFVGTRLVGTRGTTRCGNSHRSGRG